MKKILILFIVLAILTCGCNPNGSGGTTPNVQIPTGPTPTAPTEPSAPSGPPAVDPDQCTEHKDVNNDGYCDDCYTFLIVYVDFYSINDLHGKFVDNDSQPGVDELTTYLKNAREKDDYAFFLSAGDMWQGGAESNITKGQIITDWMNELDFTSMTIGNHEFDWSSEYIKKNAEIAEFPFLAINIYDRQTNERVEYCDASVVVEAGGLQIGIIGAIGDHYGSIAEAKCKDVYFKTGSELTTLVKEESTRLKNQGVDFIVYVIHGDGADYDYALSSSGYVNLVFEGHTHQGYTKRDNYGVYHLQNKGDNADGISHVEIQINSVTNAFTVKEAGQIIKFEFDYLDDDPLITELLEKYKEELSIVYDDLGYNRTYRDDTDIEALVAKLYYQKGVERWGDKYDIVLGGGSFNTRSPYNLYAGTVTYAHLMSLLPFDNDIALCAVKGSVLKNKFFNNGSYNLYYETYGQSVMKNIDSNATYYIIADSWTYDYLDLTVVENYDFGVFARDLLADYIRNGGFA